MMSSNNIPRLLGGDVTDCVTHAQALISLNAMYDKQRCAGQAMPCEAEFRAYHLLTLIGTHGRYRYDATEYQGALAVSFYPYFNTPISCFSVMPSKRVYLGGTRLLASRAMFMSILRILETKCQNGCSQYILIGLCMCAGSVRGGPVLGGCAAGGVHAPASGERQLGSLPAAGYQRHLPAGLPCAHVLPGRPSKGPECHCGSR